MNEFARRIAIAIVTILPIAVANAQQPPAQPRPPAAPATPPILPPGPLAPAFIAVVGMAQLQQQATAYRGVQEQMERFGRTMQTELGQRETQLRNTEQELVRVRSTLPEAQFVERARAFETQFAEFQRNVQARRIQLEEAEGNARRQVENALSRVLQEIAEARSLNLILARESTLLNAADIDITGEVIQRLNQALPRVNVTLPALRQQAAPTPAPAPAAQPPRPAQPNPAPRN
jgi:Skp family chaperone for outer membrane proteins